ncbi:MAG: 16S rRNA (uracil(1498)-N(3))-methyltransferase [Lachnospiraceae bacterium]|nr:16S rRNA (uracil(1498)-N(3))-methyltransferase [Lachnospiraceae bacterium]
MYHFFVDENSILGDEIIITGSDYNHAVNVLRLKNGERIMVSDESGTDYYCTVGDPDGNELRVHIEEKSEENHELPARVVLYQSLPKSDKMELIIQKATELGVTDIVPVESRNCIMKLEPKKVASKIARWQSIAEAAAKQSKRSVIPAVHDPMTFVEAVKRAEEESSVRIIPYEDERGMTGMCEAIISFLPGSDIAVFVGPEGGYDKIEIRHAMNHGIKPVSLGKRILRAETAAISILSLIMIRLEIALENGLKEE